MKSRKETRPARKRPATIPVQPDKDEIAKIRTKLEEATRATDDNTSTLDLSWFLTASPDIVDPQHPGEPVNLSSPSTIPPSAVIPYEEPFSRLTAPYGWTPEQIKLWYSDLERAHRGFYDIGEQVMKLLCALDAVDVKSEEARETRRALIKSADHQLDVIDRGKAAMASYKSLLYPLFKQAIVLLKEEKRRSKRGDMDPVINNLSKRRRDGGDGDGDGDHDDNDDDDSTTDDMTTSEDEDEDEDEDDSDTSDNNHDDPVTNPRLVIGTTNNNASTRRGAPQRQSHPPPGSSSTCSII